MSQCSVVSKPQSGVDVATEVSCRQPAPACGHYTSPLRASSPAPHSAASPFLPTPLCLQGPAVSLLTCLPHRGLGSTLHLPQSLQVTPLVLAQKCPLPQPVVPTPRAAAGPGCGWPISRCGEDGPAGGHQRDVTCQMRPHGTNVLSPSLILSLLLELLVEVGLRT